MGFLALLLALFAVWLTVTGRLKRMTMMDGAMLGLAIVGAIMAARGRPIIGGAPLLISALYTLRRNMKPRAARSTGRPPSPFAEDAAIREARALLGVDEHADAAQIKAAHRRLIAKIHPDAGGTEALAEKINQARAILLRHTLDESAADSPPPPSSQ